MPVPSIFTRYVIGGPHDQALLSKFEQSADDPSNGDKCDHSRATLGVSPGQRGGAMNARKAESANLRMLLLT
jgi:hypothetical protein